MSGLNREAWQKAIEEATLLQTDPNAMTAQEFAAFIGKEVSAAARVIKKLLAAGKITKVQKRITDGIGRYQYVSAYRLIEENTDVRSRTANPRRRRPQ